MNAIHPCEATVITGQQVKRAMRYTPTRQDRIRNVVEDLGELLKNNAMPQGRLNGQEPELRVLKNAS